MWLTYQSYGRYKGQNAVDNLRYHDTISPMTSTSSSLAEEEGTWKRKMEMSNVDIIFVGPGASLIARKKT
jgi:hypothetical protein